jgi:hypothetical protein
VSTSKSSISDRDRLAIAGVKTVYGNLPAIVLRGVSYAPADVIKAFQAQIDAVGATAKAKAAYDAALAAERTASASANGIFKGLKAKALSDFENQPEVLNQFGFKLPSRKTPSAEEKAQAVAKRDATRAARHTMGKRQKAGIKGTVPETTPAPQGSTGPAKG